MGAIETRAIIWIGYAVIVIVVFLSMFAIMNKMMDGTGFRQEVYARDIAFSESLLMSDDFEHIFARDVNPDYVYSFFEDCRVQVNKKNHPEKSGAEYYCADNLNFDKEFKINKYVKYYKLIFESKDNLLNVEGESNG